MSKFKLASGVILLFLVGVLAGSLGAGIYFERRIKGFEAGGPPVHTRVEILLHRFSKDLGLTDGQKVEIEKILRESQEQIMALGREVFPQIEEINENSMDLIKDKLSSEQQKKLDVLYKKLDHFHRRFSHRTHPSPEMRGRIIAEMKDRLKLTPEQEKRVTAIIEASNRQREEEVIKRDMIRQEIREIDKSLEKSLSRVLTKEQMDEYRRMLRERRH